MAASTPILDSLYPTFELNPAVRRTARAGATSGVGLQRRRARFRLRWLRPVSFTLLDEVSWTPGRSSNSRRASGVLRASRWEASGPRDSASRKSTAIRPRRAPLAPLKRRPRRGRRFLSEPRYSLSTYSSSPPAESSNELRQVTAHRVGWRRTARLKEPQKLGPFGFGLSSNSVGCGLRRPARASKMPRRKPGGSASRKSSANSSAQRGAKTDCGFRA